ncbi:uracil phosphoribosyltransferase [Salinisphaera orenii MK-B5]|uniref:Uracil phosphoribosyltransferase n=1 Tax=Salinisphaera orenii MK-B5 TaxID=856730 RepID=A0A423PT67_9GAMM|nr:bifunctional pyr operon transcriptional regulator/uracil phosphoribosyltransferase PyrR [Salinisphaera orenii]ROO28721.1 uracil phosphoribosyltransferase [Salinisphaera orenii MK-B5]
MNDDAHDTFDVDAAIAALRAQLAPRIATTPDAVLVGIETGGAWIASRLHAELGLAAPLCTLNISFYRDDFSTIGLHPSVGPSHIPAEIDGKTVILVDDVLYTGRTVRAALNELFDYGRPAAVRLAVLVDRGARELPFAPDAVGLKLDIATNRRIKLTGPDPLRLTMQ